MKQLPLLLLASATLAHAHVTIDLKVNHQALAPLPTTLQDRRAPTATVTSDEKAPLLSWRLGSAGEEARNLSQTACQVQVATTETALADNAPDLWDSGRTELAESSTRYAGNPMPSSSWIYWRVRTWSAQGVSDWSAPGRFLTALVSSQPQQPFISFKDGSPFHKDRNSLHLPPARYYRGAISPKRNPVRAVAHVTALGIYELQINGAKVGNSYFNPGWTDYRKRAYYQSYDITPLLKAGRNTIGAIVAAGWYAGYLGYGKLVGYGPHRTGRNIYGKTPALMAEIHLFHEDGTREIVGTDTTWKTSTGPEREADFLMGETYDANKELSGWSTNDFDDSAWEPAILAQDNGSVIQPFSDAFTKNEMREFGFIRPPVLQAYPAQPVRVTAEIRPKSVRKAGPGTWIFDLGQNFAGNVRLSVQAAKGQKITLRYGEMLHPDGRLMTENLRQARATDTYIAAGKPGGETWTPRFTFHGFQFVELSGMESQPSLDSITGLVLHSDTPLTSTFECSDPVVNRIYQNAVWTQRANWIELPTDCPQRDERLGWTGDAQIYAASAAIHADVAAFFHKWLRELDESVTAEGYFPSYAPYCFGHGKAIHGTGWSDAGIIVPHALWQATGDTSFFTLHWPAMTRFMEARKAHDPALQGKPFGAPWGDWLNLDDPTPPGYIELAYFTKTARMMEEMARAQGLQEDARKYGEWGRTMRANFRKQHLQPDGSIQPGSQTSYVLALDCGLLTDTAERRAAGAHLATLIRSKAIDGKTGMTTGFLGTKPLLPVLAETGHLDLAVSLLQSRGYPSWGYEVANGATTIWERWNSYTTEHGFGGSEGKMNAAMNSFCHYAFGAVTEWMFRDLAGIAPADPGYSKILLHPRLPPKAIQGVEEPVSWVKASQQTPQGEIRIHWKRGDGDTLVYTVTVPPNTTAELLLPASSPWSGGTPATTRHELGAGTHEFIVR